MKARNGTPVGALATMFMATLPGATNPRSKVYKPLSDLVALDTERNALREALERFENVGLIETAGHTTDGRPSNCTCTTHTELLAALEHARVTLAAVRGRS